MAVRVYFSRGSRDGALSHFLSAPLKDFREWYVQDQADGYAAGYYFSGDVDPELLAILDAIIEKGAAALQPNTLEQAKWIDLLVESFYVWCELKRKDLLGEQILFPARSAHFSGITPEIKKRCGDKVARLWNYIETGRAIGRPESPFPYTRPPSNAFWTHEEVALLYHRLKRFKASFVDIFGEDDGRAAECAFAAIEDAYGDGIGLIIEVG